MRDGILEPMTTEDASAYEAAAEALAARGWSGTWNVGKGRWTPGDGLPVGTSPAVREAIDADPETFQQRIRAYAYARAMGPETMDPRLRCDRCGGGPVAVTIVWGPVYCGSLYGMAEEHACDGEACGDFTVRNAARRLQLYPEMGE